MSYYGSSYWRGRWASWRDMRAGRRDRANARWGWLRVPGERGPVLWMQGFSRPGDLHLGTDLARAISDRRRDLRMILTFEQEFSDIFPGAAHGIARLGYGFGPCAHPLALKKTLERLQPFRYLALGQPAPQPLQRLLGQRRIPAVAMGCAPGPGALAGIWEAVYPRGLRQYAGWDVLGLGERLLPPVDFQTLVTIAQVEPNFRNLVMGSHGDSLFWVTGLGPADWPSWLSAWRKWKAGGRSLLFLEGAGAPEGLPRLSRWDRQILPPGSVVCVDETRWHPALSASADAIHLQGGEVSLLWQVFASGHPLSAESGLAWDLPMEIRAEARVPVLSGPAAIMQWWENVLADPMAGRQQGDEYRRLFWQARREAGDRLPEFLQRVFDW